MHPKFFPTHFQKNITYIYKKRAEKSIFDQKISFNNFLDIEKTVFLGHGKHTFVDMGKQPLLIDMSCEKTFIFSPFGKNLKQESISQREKKHYSRFGFGKNNLSWRSEKPLLDMEKKTLLDMENNIS
jgi:hypothetical protein